MLRQISDLSAICRHKKHQLAQHDQELYNAELQRLANALNDSKQKAKPRFAFSKKLNIKRSVRDEPSEQTGVQGKRSANTLSASEETVNHIVSRVVVDSQMLGVLKIDTVEKSVVALDRNCLSTVHMSNVKDSIIFLGNVEGSVYLDNVQDSTLIINCHQFRIHKSNSVHVLVSCASRRPIIENCTGMEFSQFPETLSDGRVVYRWETVDDFNWIRKERSDNWSTVEDSNDWRWLQQRASAIEGQRDDLLHRYNKHSEAAESGSK